MERRWLVLDQIKQVLDKIHEYEAVIEDWRAKYPQYQEDSIKPLSIRLGKIEEQCNSLFVKVQMRELASEHGMVLETDDRFLEEYALSHRLEEDVTAFQTDFQSFAQYIKDPHAAEIQKRECLISQLRHEITVVRQQVAREQYASENRSRSRFVFRKKMNTSRKRNLKLGNENTTLKSNIHDATNRISEINQTNADLQKELDSAGEAFEDLYQCWDNDSHRLKEELEELRTIANSKEGEITKLKKSNGDKEVRYLILQSKNITLEKRVKSNSREIIQMVENLTSTQAELQDAKVRVEIAGNELLEKNYRIDDLETRQKKLEGEVASLTNKNITLRQEGASNDERIRNLRTEIATLKTKLSADCSMKSELKEHIQSLEDELERVNIVLSEVAAEQGAMEYALQGDEDGPNTPNHSNSQVHPSGNSQGSRGIGNCVPSHSSSSHHRSTSSLSWPKGLPTEREKAHAQIDKLSNEEVQEWRAALTEATTMVPGVGYHLVRPHFRRNRGCRVFSSTTSSHRSPSPRIPSPNRSR